MQPHQLLTEKAANLAKFAMPQWREFLQALSAYADVHTTNLVNSPLAELPINQGRAQILSLTVKLLSECLQNADKIKKDKP